MTRGLTLLSVLLTGCGSPEPVPSSDPRASIMHPLDLPEGITIDTGWVEPGDDADAR